MTGLEMVPRGYRISVHPHEGNTGLYRVSYSPRSLQQVRGANGEFPSAPPDFVALVQVQDEVVQVRWENPPNGDHGPTRADFEHDATARVRILHEWFARLSSLVHSVEGWAKELGWSTRVIEKGLDDSQIGKYEAPALLLQEGTTRILLEPITRLAPGTEGVVDLYLMPAYDDVASLYYEDGQWILHYMFSGPGAIPSREAPAKALSKETLQEVLAVMTHHAA